jgi:hypothetical protein
MIPLPDHFWTIPATAQTTMPRKQLQSVLLASDGAIIACGRLWDIVSKNLGAGVYRVSLKERG